MVVQRPSQWPALFDLTIDIFDNFRRANNFTPHWSFGGGTALMLMIDHRESHDVDIFLDDAQALPYLNPETQGYALSRLPDSYETDGTRALKLAYRDVGEIDFICCPSILDDPFTQVEVRGRIVDLETPAEIIAKKVFFRGSSFQPRDMFDLAAVAEHYGPDYVTTALRKCGADRCAAALGVVEKASPAFVRAIIGQLMLREKNSHLVTEAQALSRHILQLALSGAVSETRPRS